MDSANRRGVAIRARRVSVALDLLAAAPALGRRRGLAAIWRTLLGALDEEGLLRWGETFLDGSFAPAKKGARSRQNQAGQGDEVDGGGRRSRSSSGRLRCHAASPVGGPARGGDASDDPGRTAHRAGRPRQKPERVIADRGYDSDPLRKQWQKRGIELIAPYRKNNQGRRYEIGANCGVISAVGLWSELMRGLVNSDACWSVMSICSPLTAPSSISRASGLP